MITKKSTGFQARDKFFYAVPSLFPVWNYPSRLAIGMKLDDFDARNAPFFNFKIKDKMYRISREKAFRLGSKYVMPGGILPNLIPKEEFKIIDEEVRARKIYDFDETTHTAFLRT